MDKQVTPEGAVESINSAIGNFLAALTANEVKLTVVDVLRLIDMRKQLANNEVREVRVRWVESNPAPLLIKK